MAHHPRSRTIAMVVVIGALIASLMPAIALSQRLVNGPDGEWTQLEPLGDAHVQRKYPRTNAGSASSLRAHRDPTVVPYLKFRVPDRVDKVDEATLWLRVKTEDAARVKVYTTSSRWSESQINWKNAPERDDRMDTVNIPAGVRRWVAIDVSDAVDGPGVYSFAVYARRGHRAVFTSSESKQPPVLTVASNGAEAPPPSVTEPPSTSEAPSTSESPTSSESPTTTEETSTTTASTTSSTTSTTTSSTPPIDPGGQPEAPITAAFFYPWFPNAWDQGGQYPFSQFNPVDGLYDSADSATIDRQISQATGAGLEAFISSWWGVDHHTDNATQAVLDRIPASPNPAFRSAIYYEPEGYGDPSPSEIAADLDYLDRLFDKPGYLRVDDKPVVFVWAESSDGSGMASRWAQAEEIYGGGLHVVLKVYSGYEDDPNQPDSWHQYGPAKSYSEHLPWSANVSPGFYHANEGSARLSRDPARFRRDVQSMVDSGAFWQLITSWNEWGEGTIVEPATEFDTTYLDIMAEELGGTSTTSSPPPPVETTTTTSTPPPSPPPSPGDSVTFAAGGDFGITSATNATFSSMANSGAEFLLGLGDLSYDDGTAEEWCDFVSGHLGSDFPVPLITGNHEDDDRVDGVFIDEFTGCLPDRMNSTGIYGAEYYFDVGDMARVIMIGADNDVNGEDYTYEVGNGHYQWLESTIADARNAGIPWVIVGMHKVCLTAGNKPCEVGPDLYNLLMDKADLVLHGHDHDYQRSKQLTCATPDEYQSSCVADSGADGHYTKGAGGVFVINGNTGGGGFTDIDQSDPEYKYLAAWHGANSPDAGRGYMLLTVDNTSLEVDFVGSTTSYSDHFVIS